MRASRSGSGKIAAVPKNARVMNRLTEGRESNNGEESSAAPQKVKVRISRPVFPILKIKVKGNADLCINRWSEKAGQKMRETQEAGSTSNKKRKRDARKFEDDFNQCYYRSPEGWYGVSASAFRKAMVSACGIPSVDFNMTHAKKCIFIMADGVDSRTGTPLVRLYGDEPKMKIHATRNANGSADLRARAFFERWEAAPQVRYDAEVFTETDIVHLMMRAGMQIGIGEGRPDSKKSAGMDWGTFDIVEE